MKRPKVLKWRQVKHIFASYGIGVEEGKSSGHKRPRHPMLVHPDGRKYPIPVRHDGDDVRRVYIEAARRKFDLTPEDGISHEEFYSRA